MAKKKLSEEKQDEAIKVPPIELSHATITIVGESPLMVHRFTDKASKQMKDKQSGTAKTAKGFRDPEAEYEDAFYKFPKGYKYAHGIPASGLKLAAVSACRFVDGMKMTQVKGAFHVLPQANGLVPITKGTPVMDESIVRVGKFGNKQPDFRYRPRWDEWEISFKITYNKRIITPEQILNLYENAGFSVGLCEHRPEKGGAYGMFRVKRA